MSQEVFIPKFTLILEKSEQYTSIMHDASRDSSRKYTIGFEQKYNSESEHYTFVPKINRVSRQLVSKTRKDESGQGTYVRLFEQAKNKMVKPPIAKK